MSHVGAIGEWTVKKLLEELRKVSNSDFHKSGKWTIWEQIGHTHSEVSELFQAVTQDDPPFSVLMEIWDIAFSAITNAHVLGYKDSQLIGGLEMTMDKIKHRAGLGD